MSRPIASTHGVYTPGIGITITKANIADEQARRVEQKRQEATPHDIVVEFATPCEQISAAKPMGESYFMRSKLYQRRLARAMRLMKRG